MLNHVGFFDGIGAFSLGLERAGFASSAYSEVKPYSVAVHESRFVGVPNLGDINTICMDGVGPRHRCPIPTATVWTGGFPCSDLSVMGKRKGLHGGDRSSLALVFLDLIDRHRPEWIVLENVPGLLSSAEGRDLGTLLGTLVELGYGWAYRLLDARNFGLPQSRRRVFIVAGPTANGAGAVLDEATPRGLAVEPLGGAGRAPVARGPRGADPDSRTVVIGPTYSRGGDSRSISRANDTFPLTPSNEQYVLEPDGPIAFDVYNGGARRDAAYAVVPPGGRPGHHQYVVDDPAVSLYAYGGHDRLAPQQQRGFASAVRPPAGGNTEQYVVEPTVIVAGFPKRQEQHLPSRDDGASYALTPGIIPYVVEPSEDERRVAIYVSKYGPAARDDGRSYLVKPHAWSTEGQYVLDPERGDVRLGRGDGGGGDGDGPVGPGLHGEDRPGRGPERVPADAGQEADSDGVREAAGLPGRLDDRDPGDGEDVWPERLDAARWHVLGRTLPVPIAEWIGAGLRTVIETMAADPTAYADD